MFDAPITIFNININAEKQNTANRLVIASCKAIMKSKTYSELEDSNYAYLNNNDYNQGFVDFTVSFLDLYSNPYMQFYISCFSLRGFTETQSYTLKVNCPRPKNALNAIYHTAINENGNLSIGLRYHFQNKEERDLLLNSKEISIEGNIALGRKSNIYDVLIRAIKENNEWKIENANTYRTHKHTSIYNLYH